MLETGHNDWSRFEGFRVPRVTATDGRRRSGDGMGRDFAWRESSSNRLQRIVVKSSSGNRRRIVVTFYAVRAVHKVKTGGESSSFG
jgi:hypothetical protein